jgi:recombinational DNA repair protein (RecF pathway)
MSYATYITEAMVCGTFNRNTADRTYLLFTREAGMLFADARSVREERSRQRYALQDFSRIRVSLVKGKQSWKIGSVEAVANDFSVATSREARGSVVSLYRLLRRLIRGQEASPELFDFCQQALDILILPSTNRVFLESCIQIRLLSALGYVDNEAVPKVVRECPLEDVINHQTASLLAQMRVLHDQAIEHSQL